MNGKFWRLVSLVSSTILVAGCLSACDLDNDDNFDDSMGEFMFMPGSVMRLNDGVTAKIAALPKGKLNEIAGKHLAVLKRRMEEMESSISADNLPARRHLDEANRQIQVAANLVLQLEANDQSPARIDKCSKLVASFLAVRREMRAAEIVAETPQTGSCFTR